MRLLEQQRHEQDSVRNELDRVRDEFVRQTRLAAIGQVAASIAHDLRNPLCAIRNGGKITVNAQSQSNFDTIRVRDEGPGVASEIRKQIFEPLLTGKAKGTGLGLSICRKIVERRGARIDLLRSDDAGAEFEIRLPRRVAAPMEVNGA